MTSKTARNILLFLLLFLGLGALFGGGVLIISPSGKLIGMPLSLLNKSPFSDFLFPGIILFGVLGVFPVLLVFALINKPSNPFLESVNFFSDMHWSWSFSIYTAFALIIWIQVEMMFLNAVSWLHTFYMFLAIAIIFVSLLSQVRTIYRK